MFCAVLSGDGGSPFHEHPPFSYFHNAGSAMKLNKAERIMAAAERDSILGISNASYDFGGIERFSGLDVGRLDALLAAGHADPYERHNEAPSIAEFREFLAAHPRFTAHGYAVGPQRDDYRLSIEGVELRRNATSSELSAFKKVFSGADELVMREGKLFCWYD